jgi:hypothetical protein
MGAFAAHPVTQDHTKGVAHADWPGYFAARAEERFGGIGMHFMTGLGNVTGAKHEERDATGNVTRPARDGAGDLLPPVGTAAGRRPRRALGPHHLEAAGHQRAARRARHAGFFDRQFDNTPASVNVGKSSTAPCTSAAPQSVELPATVVKIGDDVGPDDRAGRDVLQPEQHDQGEGARRGRLPARADQRRLGYMPQSFELNPVGQQGLGLQPREGAVHQLRGQLRVDRCVGDMVLETTLRLMSDLP